MFHELKLLQIVSSSFDVSLVVWMGLGWEGGGCCWFLDDLQLQCQTAWGKGAELQQQEKVTIPRAP